MGEAIGAILPHAIGVAISPVPIIAVILMLLSRRAGANAPLFLVGWLAGLAVVAVIVLLMAGSADVDSEETPSKAASAIKLVLGLLLLFLAMMQWRGRPKAGEEPEMPKWMTSIDSLTPVAALGIGALFSALNPKNLALTLAAALVIAQAGLRAGESAVSLVVFVAVASISVATPVLLFFVLGERAQRVLNEWKSWLAENNATVMAVLLVVLGVVLIGNSIGGLSE